MTRAGCPTGEGITIRVYEVNPEGHERELVPLQESRGWRPVAAPERKREAPAGV